MAPDASVAADATIKEDKTQQNVGNSHPASTGSQVYQFLFFLCLFPQTLMM